MKLTVFAPANVSVKFGFWVEFSPGVRAPSGFAQCAAEARVANKLIVVSTGQVAALIASLGTSFKIRF